jgi:hypothetical protein
MTYMGPFPSAGNTDLLQDSCDMAGYVLGYAVAYHNRSYLFVFGATAHSGPGPPHSRGF